MDVLDDSILLFNGEFIADFDLTNGTCICIYYALNDYVISQFLHKNHL